ncbi:MAG: hypothetical protein KF819_07700 [Labilithrix sp.]|nr:hypothetical protein [Labilithrix sp.]
MKEVVFRVPIVASADFGPMTNRTAPRRLRFLRACATLALPAALLLVPKSAGAQEWLKDRRYAEGAGVRVGDLELHPGIGGEVGYDSNWFLRTYKDGYVNSGPVEAGIIRITPSFSISTLSEKRLNETATEGVRPEPPPVAFRGTIAATYREFLGPAEIRDQRNVSGNAGLRLDVNQGRPVGFGVFANYTRLIQPAVLQDPNLSFNRSDVGVGGDIIFLPGGGTLDLRAGYQFYGAFFEESNGAPYTNHTHEISIRNRWRFRPRTALFHDTSLRFINYPNAQRALNFLNDSTPLRTQVGVTGLMTDRFGLLLSAGYGASFFRNGAAPTTRNYDSLNARAEGTFYLSEGGGAAEPGQATLLLSTFTFGFSRDFQNSLLGNYYDSNKGYLRLVYYFGGKVLAQLDGFFEALGYPQPFYNDQTGTPAPLLNPAGQPITDFTNYRTGGSLFAEYRFTDSFGLNLTFDYQQMISDTQLPSGVGPPPVADPANPNAGLFDLNWRRVQALVGARWFL